MRSDRKYYRNEENTGTIMEWKHFGIGRKTLILDEKFRGSTMKWGPIKPLFHQAGHINFSYNIEEGISDEELDNFIFPDVNTSEHNTNFVLNELNYIFNDGENIFKFCGKNGYSVPNIHTLIRIFSDHKIIDSMDFGDKLGLSKRFNTGVWSSTEYSNGFYAYQICSSFGNKISIQGKSYDVFTIPVIELNK